MSYMCACGRSSSCLCEIATSATTAAPSEPPAEACIYCGRRHLGVELPDCPPVPAVAQQDDEVERAAQAIWESQPGTVPWSELSPRTPTRDEYRRFARAALAARPSTDTETLDLAQQVLARHQRRDIKGCSCGSWGSDHGHMGQSHGLHVLAELRTAGLDLVRTALDGDQ